MIRLVLLLSAALGMIFLAGARASAAPFTPLEWQRVVTQASQHCCPEVVGQRKHVGWGRDRNRNYIDDEIERRFGPGDRVNVILELNSCMTPKEIKKTFSRAGEIVYVSKFITYVMVDEVRFEHLQRLAIHPRVAMVEWQAPVQFMSDVSTRAVQARSSNTFRDNSAQDLNLTGAGVNVAIMDSGVDDTHESLRGKFVAGFNAWNFSDSNVNGIDDSCEPRPLGNGVCTDPDDEPADGTTNPRDDEGHGTLVASIAIGAGAAGRVCRSPDDGSPTNCAGVAPGAGLVDVRICPTGGACGPREVAKALDWVAINAARFNIRVVNMSLGFGPDERDDTSALPQQVNYLVALGVNVVIAGGNAVNLRVSAGTVLVPSPASASFAITVNGTNDRGTVTRTDDGRYSGYLRGPRADFDSNSPNLLALKPDISAPGENVRGALTQSRTYYVGGSGTSLSAPHVAGAVAIILEAHPRMHPGSVKDLLKRSADTTHNVPQFPAIHPTWDSALGAGMLNVWTAVSTAAATDVKFPTCVGPGETVGRPCELSPPLPPWDNELDISTATPPQVGVANTITAQVRNDGGVPATVLVNFGVYVYAAGNNQFFHIGTRQVTIPATTTVPISLPWTPASSDHQCIQVSVDFGFDTDNNNNVTQRNLQVAASDYDVRIENPFMVPARFRIQAESDRAGWVCRVSESDFTLDPFADCPRSVHVTFDAPRGTPPGERANCNVAVFARPEGGLAERLIGGVTARTFVPKPCVLEGEVVTPSGAPVSGARIMFEKANETHHSSVKRGPRTAAVTTKLDGSFSVTLPADVVQVVRVEKSGVGKGQALLRVDCGKRIRYVLSRSGLTWSSDLQPPP
jgi:subtilisin family serine protease